MRRRPDPWADIPTPPMDFRDCLRACGAHGARVAEFDWGATSFGPIDTWPDWLRVLALSVVASPHPMTLRLLPDLATLFNAALTPMLGKRAEHALGAPFTEIWPELTDELAPLFRDVVAGETVRKENLPLWLTRNGFEELAHWTLAYSPVRDPEGRVVGILSVVSETTAQVKAQAAIERANESLTFEVENAVRALAARDAAERQQELLKAELVHRMKNMLAVISAMVTHSIKGAASLEQAATATAARLAAFARVQEVFSDDAWSNADLSEVVRVALEPHTAGVAARVAAFGPELRLGARHALGIALAVHELATNALKYGALANDSGRVEIGWMAAGECFEFTWHETGGPPVAEPAATGFGSVLTDRVVPAYFSGAAVRQYDPGGLCYTLRGMIQEEP